MLKCVCTRADRVCLTGCAVCRLMVTSSRPSPSDDRSFVRLTGQWSISGFMQLLMDAVAGSQGASCVYLLSVCVRVSYVRARALVSSICYCLKFVCACAAWVGLDVPPILSRQPFLSATMKQLEVLTRTPPDPHPIHHHTHTFADNCARSNGNGRDSPRRPFQHR